MIIFKNQEGSTSKNVWGNCSKELLNFKYVGGVMLTVSRLFANWNWQRVNYLMHSFQGFSFLPFGFSWLNINLIMWKHFKVLVKKRPKWQLISGTTLLSTIIHKLYRYNSRLAVGVKWLMFMCSVFCFMIHGFGCLSHGVFWSD